MIPKNSETATVESEKYQACHLALKSILAETCQELKSIRRSGRSQPQIGGQTAFDSKTLRVIAEAEGALNVTVTKLPNL